MDNKILKQCEECGKEFFVWPYIIKLGKGHFCSSACRKVRAGDKLTGVRKRTNNIIHLDSHCEMIIKNKRGVFRVLFDKEDIELVDKHTWMIANNGYVSTNTRYGLRGTLHRLVMKTPDGMDTDHKYGDTLDNRKKNLRICTTSQNMANTKKRAHRSYKGVHKTPSNTYHAKIKKTHLGAFSTAELAAKAYNEAAKKEFGEFARLNSI